MALQYLVTTTWTLWCIQIVSRKEGGEGREQSSLLGPVTGQYPVNYVT